MTDKADAQELKPCRLRDALAQLIEDSEGVAGLHHNGDVAPWESLLEGGEYEAWLRVFDERCPNRQPCEECGEKDLIIHGIEEGCAEWEDMAKRLEWERDQAREECKAKAAEIERYRKYVGLEMTPEEIASMGMTVIRQTNDQLREQVRVLREAILSVCCDPEGKACMHGSDGDRAVIDEALTATEETDNV
jgi:hypothetical protein